MINIHQSKNAGMFNRRNKGVIQTSIILILIIGVGYGFYLYNILQVKLKHMDVREQRYLNQHQSLSSQLQVVYAERSRLEGSFQKEKNEHQNTKLELENVKETHDNLFKDMEQEHKNKYEELELTLLSSQNELEGVKQNYVDVKSKHDATVAELHSQLSELRDELSNNQGLDDVLKQKKDEIRRLEENYKEAKEFQSNLNLDLQKAKTEVENYKNLKSILQEVGIDVLKIDHPKLETLSAQSRMDFFAHFGGTQKHAEIIENNRNQLQQEKLEREVAVRKQEEQRKQQIALKQNQQNLDIANEPDLKDNCHLPVDAGTCVSQIARFYFDSATSSCQPFLYTGCGGNMNNFDSFQDCFDKCNIGEKKEVLPQNDNLSQDQINQKLQNNADSNNINVVANNNDESENMNQNDNNVFGDQDRKDMSNVEEVQVNEVQAQEDIARLAEQNAQNELQQQQQQPDKLDSQDQHSVKDLDISEIQEKFLENQKEIKKIDDAQFENIDKLLQQKKEKKDNEFIEGELLEESDPEEAEIGEENDENLEEEDGEFNNGDMGGDLGEDNGMLQDGEDEFENRNNFEEEEDRGNLDEPPAAKIAGEEDLPVLDAPFRDRNDEEREKQDNYEDNYDENNNGEEEDEDDYNEEDKEEDERYKAEERMDDPFDEGADDNNEEYEKRDARMREM